MKNKYILDLLEDDFIKPGNALDLGCGSGSASYLLASLGFTVEAVDLYSKHVETGKYGDGKIKFSKADVRDFNIKKNKYNFIHARNLLHFLNKEQIVATIEKIIAGLKKNGVAYFNVSGDEDGWVKKSKNVTFLNTDELKSVIEPLLTKSSYVYSKVNKVGYGYTTNGHFKLTHTITYTVCKK